jgi:hypothetical protein
MKRTNIIYYKIETLLEHLKKYDNILLVKLGTNISILLSSIFILIYIL